MRHWSSPDILAGLCLAQADLVKAYTELAQLVVNAVGRGQRVPVHVVMLAIPYNLLERVRLLAARHHGEILGEDFAGDITLTVQIPVSDFEAFQLGLRELSAGKLQAEVIETKETDHATVGHAITSAPLPLCFSEPCRFYNFLIIYPHFPDLLENWQLNNNLQSLAFFAFSPDLAFVHFDNGFGNGETESRAALFAIAGAGCVGAVETVKEMRGIFGGDSVAVVLNGDFVWSPFCFVEMRTRPSSGV